jgi:non-specific protein-tyrosine kinase
MQTIDLNEYLMPLRRWWWLVLASTLLAGLSSAFLTLAQPDRYQSRATVMVGAAIQDPNPDSMQFYMSQQLATTYADLAQRPTVQEATMNALDLSWLPGYNVVTVPNTQLLEIIVTDTDPTRAKAVADELVNQLILRSPAGREEQARQDFVAQELAEMERGIRTTKDEISQRQNELANMFSARQIADAQSQIAALENKLTSLQLNYTSLLATTQRGAVNTINVVEPANMPFGPLNSGLLWNVLLAAAVGFMLGAGGAYFIEYLDDSVKNSTMVERDLGCATLGAIPEMTSEERASELVMLGRSHSPTSEAYRVLRTNLQFAAVARQISRLLVTSPSPGEGKSTTAANLAIAIAQSGRRVVLIDADLHRPRQHRVFKLVNNVGVTTALLADSADLEHFLQRTSQIPNLAVLTSGPLPPNPAELLGSQRMHSLLTNLETIVDVVIIDSPPTTAVADTAVLATAVDGVLLVVETGKTGREPARRAIAALRQVQAHVVGIVLNRMPTRGSGYYYYHYNYDRKYYRRDDVLATAGHAVTPAPVPAAVPPTVAPVGNPLLRTRGHEVNGNGASDGAPIAPLPERKSSNV